jgi:hypothetical protein
MLVDHSANTGILMSGSDKPSARRVVRRDRSGDRIPVSWSSLRPAEIWATLRSYVGPGAKRAPSRSIRAEALAQFLDSAPASWHRPRSMGTCARARDALPRLDDDPYVVSINIAKWHVWLDCLSDIAVYAGSRLAQGAPREMPRVARMMVEVVDRVLAQAGTPAEAGGDFAAHAQRARDRVARTDWLSVDKDEAAFTESPAGLVRWAPVMDDLKELDRKSCAARCVPLAGGASDFSRQLDPEAMLGAMPGPPSS